MRVLVVDDDESISEFVSLALAEDGHDVITAFEGQHALEVAREAPLDLILLDVRMPVMNGREFASEYFRLPGPHAPIVVLTAARDAQGTAAPIDAAAVLAKPFDLDELLQVVEQFSPPSGSPLAG
jgi:DNA-binding response OmpR family regulator